ncbi:hypothetical protein PCASD_01062 [Puccinia coronata f. sp. avenae]|uniref:Helicase ATP-binding domain-containing protein n=1 Tax=Puccinia coronata f. sp. avenae TaxID=200324 RepID=A0A2N5VMX6_9BASI|nr:hypothetical protein PCASD_01062 [Puccinia coronata f. sp. avenae]
MFFSSEFQSRLVLIVLDEAHMVYVWGLVELGKAKFLSVRDRLQDNGIFQPFYGKLASLMIKGIDIGFFRGELVQPKIQILRFYTEYPLKSCEDLLRMFSKQSEIRDEDLLPMLIYLGTRKATLSVINVVNIA